MIVSDRIYGKVKIDSTVIITLIKSGPLQRLKGIGQFGIPDKYYYKKNYTRFEHCLGVMLLLKKLGATEEEQIAGLLHDVSHTAFSHVYDWVIGEGKGENYQDMIHKDFINSSEIPIILKKFRFDPKRISDYHNFGLLERKIPDLCADRIDYALREFPKSVALKCILSLTVKNNKIVFNNRNVALLFAQNFLQRQIQHWGGFEAACRYRIFANALRKALEIGEITFDDFWQDDQFIVSKIDKSKDKYIQKILKTLSKKSLKNFPKSKIKVYKKFRYVDPLFIENNKILRLSKANKYFKRLLISARLKNKKGAILPLVV